MKAMVLVGIFTFSFVNLSLAASSNPEYDFIRWYMEIYGSQFDGKAFSERKIVFSDRLNQATIKAIERYLLKDTIVNRYKSSPDRPSSDSLFLNGDEKCRISTALSQMGEKAWDQAFIPGSKLLPLEKLKRTAEAEPFFSFSKPMFLKNGQICIFYCSYYCGNMCASAELCIFRNVNGKWQKMFEIERWIS